MRKPPPDMTAELEAARLRPLRPFPGHGLQWQCLRLNCRAVVRPTPYQIANGQAGCVHRSQGTRANRQPIPEDEALAIVQSAGLRPLVRYPGGMRPWACQCVTCGRVIQAAVHRLALGHRGCIVCADNTQPG